jgi:crotonobetainyl-CoA:carnitine CoA-transferase CaiB-like acyl-CoA transferase
MVRMLAGTPVVGSPVRIDGARADSDLPPPTLGEHTAEVLQELGIAPAEIARLRSEAIVGG